MIMQPGAKISAFLLLASTVFFSHTLYADLTFQAFDVGGGVTRLTVVSASGSAIDSSNDAYFYGFGTVVPWDGELDVMANAVSGTIGGSTLKPNQFLLGSAGFDGNQTGWQIALSSDAGSLVGSDASIDFPIDPSNFSTQYTLNRAFGSGDLGVITILPAEILPPEFSTPSPVPLGGAVGLIVLLGLTGLTYSRRRALG